MARSFRLSIFGILSGFTLLAAVLPLAIFAPALISAADAESERRTAESLNISARRTSNRLSEVIADHWREHEAIARVALSEGVGNSLSLRLDTAKMLNERLVWMGLASPDGRVLASTGQVLMGVDVSARPWFRAGLQDRFAGDLHDALLLARLLPRADGQPLKLFDFAGPLRRPDGTLLGVLGVHVDWLWLRDLVRGTTVSPGFQSILVSREGVVLAGPLELEGKPLNQRIALSARQGLSVTTTERWEDGRDYTAGSQRVASVEGLPNFGWSVIVRTSPATIYMVANNLMRALFLPLLLCSGAILLLGFMLASRMSRDLGLLSRAANALSSGRSPGPMPEGLVVSEAKGISDALARLEKTAGETRTFPGGDQPTEAA